MRNYLILILWEVKIVYWIQGLMCRGNIGCG
jgi:hypothetical protein